MRWAFVIDNRSCIGCHACSTACKSENEVPLGVYRTWVKTVESGAFPDVRRSFQVTRCNHCENPPCVAICPVKAMYQRPDGIVEFNSDSCIGCKGCLQACPYDAIHLDPETHTAAKCHFCSHRIDVGLEPACVVVCPTHSIMAGDLDDPGSEVSRVLAREDAVVRKPEQGTAPKLFYIGGRDAGLHPTASTVGASMAAVDGNKARSARLGGHAQGLPAGGPITGAGTLAGHLVSYEVTHHAPWHWPIPVYLITKAMSAGGMGLLALAALRGGDAFSFEAFRWAAPMAWLALLVTLGLLVYDLDRPDRFHYLLLRPQWRSWIARAAYILTAFFAVSTAWIAAEFLDLTALRIPLALLTLPLAVASATYTAFLFAQAEGRDYWQSVHLLPVMAAQAAALGGLLIAAGVIGQVPEAATGLGTNVAVWSCLVGLCTTVVGDAMWPHASEGAVRAAFSMVRGRWSSFWWGGLVFGWVAPMLLLAVGLAPLALVVGLGGMCLGAWAVVMAPQDIPNS